MLELSANPDFLKHETGTIEQEYYDLDGSNESNELWGAAALDQMIENVLLTEKFERLFNLSFSSPIYDVLFQNFDNANLYVNTIFDIIEFWVPIKIDRSNAKIEQIPERNALAFQIPYISNNGQIASCFARRISK
jgi:hypothetical protein